VMSERGAALNGWDLVLPLAVAGVGLGLLVVPLVDTALATVPLRDAGAASGVYGTFQQIGAALGVAISATVFFGIVGNDWSRANVMDALVHSGWIAMAGYGLSAVASLLLPPRSAVQARAELTEESDDAAEEVPAGQLR